MEATVVKEYTTDGGRHVKEMSDGRILVEDAARRVTGTRFGTFATIKGEVTEEKLAKAKEMLIEDVCRIIRNIANERDDFFIIKKNPPFAKEEYTSVAHTFFLPTVDVDEFEYSRIEDELIVE